MKMGIGLGLQQRGGGFSPASLFASGEAGDWFDPSDLSKMWQDTAGTTPITADSQTVARIDGQRGLVSLRQATALNRPQYKTSAGLHWLQFDGSDDFLISNASLDLTGYGKAQVFAGVRKLVDTAEQEIVEHGRAGTDPLTFTFASTSSSGGGYRAAVRDAVNEAIEIWGGYAPPVTNVVYAGLDYAGATIALQLTGRINGVDNAGGQAGVRSTGTAFGNYSLYIGARNGGGNAFNGNVYSLIIRAASSITDTQLIQNAEAYVASKAGVTL